MNKLFETIFHTSGMNFWRSDKKEPWAKASPEQIKAEIERLNSQRKEIETAVTAKLGEKTGLESRLSQLNNEITGKTKKLEIVDNIMSTVALLQKDEIETVYIEGLIIGDCSKKGRTAIFANGAAFARYVAKEEGKIVLHGKLVYRDINKYSSEGFDFFYALQPEALAFLGNQNAQAYFIPDFNKKSDEEE